MQPEEVFAVRKMQAIPFKMAPVDIIIPFHGEHDKVSRLMESIFNTVRTNRYQITLVDDASKNKAFVGSFKKIPGVVGMRNDKQKGFGASVNAALKVTKQPFVLILHSDVVVEGNLWLSNLGSSLNKLKGRGVKMISPLTDNPLGDDVLKAGRNELRAEDTVLEDAFLPMYCALCNRELFKRVGPLQEYPYFAGWEAEEFAMRMARSGFGQAVCGQSWVHHDGRATLSKYDDDEKVQEVLRKARAKK